MDDAFRARSGFIRRTGVTRAEARARYRWRGGRGALVESWGPGVDVGGTWARDDFWAGRGPGEAEVELNLYASFRGNVGGYLSYSRTAFSVGTDEYEGLFVAGRDGEAAVPFAASRARFRALHRLRLRSWINRWERVRISLEGSWREMPIFDLWRGLPAESGESWEGELDLWLQPTGSLSAEMGVRHATIFRDRDGSRYSSATIPRFQARYQFSRALFARAIAEYAARDRGPVLDPETGRPLLECADGVCSSGEPSATYDLSVEGLVGYEPSPGTVVFLGYTRRMRDTRGLGFQELTPETDGLFVKVAYRLRV
ncbi:MAG: hypothetical protein GWM92_20515 [Gemmatimonadetes bacterium]|nr:hypothetical protein [Gemmatimonadota bacterium]NIR81222.1 hypothetical protein [Gemmatimonadota bacterium]NIT90067.1 hypothetical protein [Gemmatimonadota bacterium]NIU33879.1 hypothetical protein [Gemmatimonadota bacterium]NIU38071.1 hypothetical protein [Gemmatimonadota bacterium]